MAKITDLTDMFPKDWRNEAEKEKHSAPGKQIATIKEFREKHTDLIGITGKLKSGMTFNNPNKISNLATRTTQLDRYRFANALSHQVTTDAVLSNGKPIRFAGMELKPGVQVFEVVSDGLDPLADNEVYETGKQLFSVKMGKIDAIKAANKSVIDGMTIEEFRNYLK